MAQIFLKKACFFRAGVCGTGEARTGWIEVNQEWFGSIWLSTAALFGKGLGSSLRSEFFIVFFGFCREESCFRRIQIVSFSCLAIRYRAFFVSWIVSPSCFVRSDRVYGRAS